MNIPGMIHEKSFLLSFLQKKRYFKFFGTFLEINLSAIQARAIIPDGADYLTMGSTAVLHINKKSGFWCINEEQPGIFLLIRARV